jgi:DNA-binding MarR family transcriptional regulator
MSAAGEQRARSLRKEIVVAEKREPLRRRLLAALAESPATPTELSGQLESPAPSVSRGLRELRETGLVVREGDAADRRRAKYFLTPEGERQLNRHYTYGPPDKELPPSPTEEQSLRLLRSAIDRAVRIRRESHRVEEAAARLRAVIREAEKMGARALALEAMAELAKTLRQNRQPAEQGELTVWQDELIVRLNDIALGHAEDYGAAFAVPAAAHLKYTLGRCGERRGEDLPTREAHLTAACSLYGQLVKNSSTPAATDWFARQAWSVISLAGNLRKQTRLERALRFATIAKRSFDGLEDEYGRAQCLFMFGFCLRLLGEFREASVCLDRAHRIADENSFERARADTLMQMGEVRRCLGDFDEARGLLSKALEKAAEMRLVVTEAFAQSALGAVEFQEGRLPEAAGYLEQAGGMFRACKHVEGMALNTRRQAAVARRIAEESTKPSYVAIERLIESAYETYEDLQSPAGIAACSIEEGRVRMLRKGGRVQPVVARLNALLASRSKCEILELDPWVPPLLHRFAVDVEDDALVKQSEHVMHEAQDLLAERGAQSVERIATVMEGIEPEEEIEIDASAAEMGGEARRDPSAFDALGLLDESVPESELQAVA